MTEFCCGDPLDCAEAKNCALLAQAEQDAQTYLASTVYDAEGNEGTLDEAYS